MKYKKLKYEDLNIRLESLPDFRTTQEIINYKEIIGQERAIRAIETGLKLKKSGYNIFVCGSNGSGRKKYILEKLIQIASDEETPDDWCYVYNFSDSFSPIALNLKPGTSEGFKNDIDNFIDSLFDEIPRLFSEEEYEKARELIIEKFQKESFDLIQKLYDEAKGKNFVVKSTREGFAFIPIRNNEEMTEQEYNELDEKDKEKITEDVRSLKFLALEVLRKTKFLKKEMSEQLRRLDDNSAYETISKRILNLKNKYGYNEKIVKYLDDLQKDVIENIDAFLGGENDQIDESFFKRYFVNVITCNKKKGAPIVFDDFPEFQNLIGVIEYENERGSLVSDFTMIKPGSLHRANGGYLIIDALQLLSTYQGWKALKNALKNEYIQIENLKNQFDIIPIVALKPERIPLNVKVILLGNEYIYYFLYLYDEDFKELFNIKAEFESEIKLNDKIANEFLGFISFYCASNNLPHVTKKAVFELFRFSMRLSENRKYLTSCFRDIIKIIDESAIICISRNGNYINEKDVKAALAEYEKRHSFYKDRVLDMYKDGKYLVQLNGYRIGEINALSVLELGDYSFGKQNRITVTTYMGKEGVINIEREANMSGTIHNKGILILSGYIGQLFGQKFPLSFNASICFEQLYGGIEGDSASAAELIALISSLGDIPIKQSIAITGSINQRGEIQPVGGINQKIEGFFDICNMFGLDGSHGVIIPFSNYDDLVLKDEVLNAIKKGLFNIYLVNNIEECFEILCSDNFIRKNEDLMEVIKKRVEEKLKRYNDVSQK
ncbi:Lon protease [Caloramator mitchellensis]|uniref:endopeptidase La n=1 Tax=Caloramator mitchellensis TaxID=908809 RepID=A0A0R3JSV5_CALMK|nr:ATP-binding protein [Caloramator mitchellensis]KRQ86595.1 Lon protease [Caloramator mitchellensis]